MDTVIHSEVKQLKNFKVHILVLILLFSAPGASSFPNVGGAYTYSNFFGHMLTINIDQRRKTVGIGHIAAEDEFCGPQDDFLCVNGELLKFAIPKIGLSMGATWEKDGVTYHANENVAQSIYLVGEQYEVFFIESVQDERKMEFLYSPEHGLLAIAFFKEKNSMEGSVYLLQSPCGFAARRQFWCSFDAEGN